MRHAETGQRELREGFAEFFELRTGQPRCALLGELEGLLGADGYLLECHEGWSALAGCAALYYGLANTPDDPAFLLTVH